MHAPTASASADAPAPALPLDSNVEKLRGVGPAKATRLRHLGLNTLGDLLEYFPRDYVSENAEAPIAGVVPDQIHTVRGEVVAVDYIAGRFAGKGRFEATIDDGADRIGLAWFGQSFLRGKIVPGMVLRVRGKVKLFRNVPQIVGGKWEAVEPDAEAAGDDKYRPVYPATADLGSEAIGTIIDDNLDDAVSHVGEWFADDLLARRGMIRRRDAYRLIHRPADSREASQAHRRLVYDELMLMQLGLGLGRRMREGQIAAPLLRVDRTLDARIRTRFPFDLTSAQQDAIYQILRDLGSGRPMNRLLQGDVGSGKTVVALYGMLVAVANKMQAVLLAPTEVLAEQHYLTLRTLLHGSRVNVALVTGRTKRAGKGSSGGIGGPASLDGTHIAVGTQALLTGDVDFANLGLVVVDEQHKLGVKQRAVLKDKGYAPHYLVMTATPIPRTLALSYFADFDVSTIDHLPPGRKPIDTRWLRPERSGEAHEFVRAQVEAGRQAYVVLPMIDDDGTELAKSVKAEFDRLRKGPLAGLKLAILHGQMSGDEKQATMSAFRDGRTDVLVATTVIEVGIDVANATTIVIDNAERFGLSQLHQLRGRVGRGTHQSHCLLIGDPATPDGEQRLRAMVKSTDGFEIAETDLLLRGPGDFFGTRQHGLPPLKLADISKELELLKVAKDDAADLLEADPDLRSPPHATLRKALIDRFGDSIPLAQVG